jgi:acyl-CoA oxidase
MSVHSLGTEKHIVNTCADIGSLKLPGCFAMTETHHGSNVKRIERRLQHIINADATFTIHTPQKKLTKEYRKCGFTWPNGYCFGEVTLLTARLR